MKKLAIFIVLAFMLVFCAVPAYANGIPALPHAFYGSVTINGAPAPPGTTVEARGEGVTTGIAGNPVTTTTSGIYGTSNPLQPRIIVQGDIDNGDTITFYVNGVSTGQTAEWHSEGVTPLNLKVTIAPPTPAPSVANGKEPPAPPMIRTDLFGFVVRYPISSEGEILETIKATSLDGMLNITIPKGTIALDKHGNPLTSLVVRIDKSPPCPSPEDACIIGLAYSFEPDGATFEPPITFSWSYDADALPEGVAEEDLIIAYCDEDAKKWVEVDCVVDTKNNVVTASVPHFTTFAIIGAVTPPPPPVPAPPAPAPVPPVLVPAPVPPPPVVPAPVPPPPVVTPTPPAPPPNWLLFGAIIAATVLVALIIFLLVRRRAHLRD